MIPEQENNIFDSVHFLVFYFYSVLVSTFNVDVEGHRFISLHWHVLPSLNKIVTYTSPFCVN